MQKKEGLGAKEREEETEDNYTCSVMTAADNTSKRVLYVQYQGSSMCIIITYDKCLCDL